MRLSALPGKVPWRRRRSSTWSSLRNLPGRSLLRLYLAIFFLFSVYGFYVNLMGPERLPLLLVIAMGIANGAYSVLYPWLLIRHPGPWIWLVAIVHFFFAGSLAWLANSGRIQHVPGPVASLTITGGCLWTLLVLSYVYFIAFIRKQATEAIRIQNELELAQGIQEILVPPIANTNNFYEIYGITRPRGQGKPHVRRICGAAAITARKGPAHCRRAPASLALRDSNGSVS